MVYINTDHSIFKFPKEERGPDENSYWSILPNLLLLRAVEK